jgi:hypothetical protein
MNDNLTFKMEKAAAYIVSGENLKNVGVLVGVSESTIFRWMRESSAFQNRIRELRRTIIESYTNDLLGLNKLAVRTLERLMTCGNFPTECRAAVSVLGKTHESIDFFEYSERLRLVEQKFSENR